MNTNQILKKVISKYYKTNKLGCKKFIKFLAVDIENCYPIDALNIKYDVKKHKNNLFLYIDENFRIIGITKGAKYKKEYYYYMYPLPCGTPKTRDGFESISKYILMFTPEMRTYSVKTKNVTSEKSHVQKLKERLEKYKMKKYESITHENIKNMVKEVIEVLTDLLFNDNINLAQTLSSDLVWSCHDNNKVMIEF